MTKVLSQSAVNISTHPAARLPDTDLFLFVLLLLSHLPPFHLLHHSFALLSVSFLASFLSHPARRVSFTLLWQRSSVSLPLNTICTKTICLHLHHHRHLSRTPSFPVSSMMVIVNNHLQRLRCDSSGRRACEWTTVRRS